MNSLEKKQILIDPNYLIQISNNLDMLNHFYQQQDIGSLSMQYRNLLINSFSKLNQQMHTHSNSIDSASLVQTAIIKCKSEIELFCMQKLAFLLSRETEQIGKLIFTLTTFYRQNMDDFQRLVLAQRRKRVQNTQNQKDLVILKLKQQLTYRKQYISELKNQIKDLENQNKKIYQRLIMNAKNVTQRTLIISPKKTNNNLTLSPSISKIKPEALLGSAHKTLSAKQVQQTISDIMQTKLKQQNVKGKRVGMKNFLKTYFRYKFGMKDLADQTQLNFKEAIQFFCESQQKNIFILFLKIYQQTCDQQFFWQQKLFLEKVTKIVKRYLNEKDGISLDELQKVYDTKIMDDRSDIKLNEKDIQYILINTYKTSQTDYLQLILSQILGQKLQKSMSQNSPQQMLVPSKKLINQILNYELSKHLTKIQDIVRVIKDLDNDRGYLNQQDIEAVIARLNISQNKIETNLSLLNSFQGKFLTHSQTIQFIEKLRKTKPKKK